MRSKRKRVSALLCCLAFLLFGPSSCVEFPTSSKKLGFQEIEDGRHLSSNSQEKIDEVLSFSTPKASPDSGKNMGSNQTGCELSKELLNETWSAESSEWIIDNKALESLGNDPQSLIQCTKPGDRVVFSLTGMNKFKKTLEVSQEIELVSKSPEANEASDDVRSSAIFACPEFGPFITIKSTGFNGSGFVLQNCTTSAGSGTVVMESNSTVVFKDSRFINNTNRAIYVAPNSKLTLRNCCFESNEIQDDDGAAINVQGSVSLSIFSSYFYNNSARYGGALYARDNIILTIQQSNFSKNNANVGGVLYSAFKEDVRITSSVFSENSAKESGGCVYGGYAVVFIVRRSTFIRNKATWGGSIYSRSRCSLTIEDSTFSENEANGGGTIRLSYRNTMTISRSNFKGNRAQNGAAVMCDDYNHVAVESTTISECVGGELSRGPALYLNQYNNASIFNSTLSRNMASQGGAMRFFRQNRLYILQSVVSSNHAAWCGGALFLQYYNYVTIRGSVFSNNTAVIFGGAVHMYGKNDFYVYDSMLTGNFAQQCGGSIYVESNIYIVISNSIISNNKAIREGGAVYFALNNVATISNSTFSNNSARDGASLFLESKSNVTIQNSTFSNNSASRHGIIYTKVDCTLTIIGSNVIGNNAAYGGFLYGVHLALSISHSKFIKNVASESGGCLYLQSSNAMLAQSDVVLNQASGDGGGIYASTATILELKECSIVSNVAEKNGGAIALLVQSKITCDESWINNNSAFNGGGVYIEAYVRQRVVALAINSRINNNSALKYGGAIVLKVFGAKNVNCSDVYMECGRALLINTTLVKNTAKQFGGALMVTRLESVLVSCRLDNIVRREYIVTVPRMRRLVEYTNSLEFMQLTNTCSTWHGNRLAKDAFETEVGTFGNKLSIKIDSDQGAYATSDEKYGLVLHNVTSGKTLPRIEATVLDVSGNVSAPLYELDTIVLHSPSGFLARPITFSFKNGTCVIEGIVRFALPGNYTIQFNPRNDDVLEALLMTIIVRECFNDEEPALNGKLCQPCGETHYNFNSSKAAGCAACPTGANCTGHYIFPIQRYWSKSPCHDKMKKCIIEKACSYPNRTTSLASFVQKNDNCNINKTRLDEYGGLQCHKGYQGPLCGSCKKSYGVSSNSECSKCANAILVVLRFLGAIIYLLVGTIITIKGVLPSTSGQQGREDIEAPMLEHDSIASIDVGNTSQVKGEIENDIVVPSQYVADEDANPLDVLGGEADDIEVTKLKLVSSWKISLNYFQVTSTAAGMDVEWTKKILNMLRGLNVLGAATTDSISYSFDCLSSSASNDSKAIWRLLFSLFVPLIVILLLSLHWGYRSMNKYGRDGFYFFRRLLLTIVTVTYATYFDLTREAMRTFSCVVVHADANPFSNAITRYWIGDTSIECYKSTHIALILISLVVVMLVTIGFPTFSSYTLNQHKSEIRDASSWTYETFGFLGGPFKQRFIYWECVTMIKKAILSIIIVFSYSLESQSQGLLILLVLVFFLYIHFLCYPYDSRYYTLNFYESGSLLVSCVTYTLVQFFNVDRCSEVSRSIVSLSIIAINVAFVCLMAYKIVTDLIRLLRALLKSRNIYVPKNMNVISLIRVYCNKRRSDQDAS